MARPTNLIDLSALQAQLNSQKVMSTLPSWTSGRRGVLLVQLEVDGPVFPGGEIVFRFKVDTLSHRPLDLGQVTASVYLVDSRGNVSPSDLVHSVVLPATEPITPDHYQSQDLVFDRQQPRSQVDALARKLYSLKGAQSLRLVLQGTGADGGPHPCSWDQWLYIQPEPVDDSWWSYDALSTKAEWKHAYQVNGQLNNRSSSSGMRASSIWIREGFRPADGSSPVQIDADQQYYDVAVGGSVRVTFDRHDFSKAWSWFDMFTFIPWGPIDRVYTYDVTFQLEDDYGNLYPSYQESQRSVVRVSVSGSKRGLDAAAQAAADVAAGLAIAAAVTSWIPWVGGALASAATTAYGVAHQLGTSANDPPARTASYRNPVVPRAFRPSADMRRVQALQPLWDMIASMARQAALVTALDTTASRLFTAEQYEDREALSLQRKTRQSLRSQLRREIERFERLITAGDFRFSEIVDKAGLPEPTAEAPRMAGHQSDEPSDLSHLDLTNPLLRFAIAVREGTEVARRKA